MSRVKLVDDKSQFSIIIPVELLRQAMSIEFQRVLADIDKDAESDPILTDSLRQVKEQAKNLGIPYPIYVMKQIHSLRIEKRAKAWLAEKQCTIF